MASTREDDGGRGAGDSEPVSEDPEEEVEHEKNDGLRLHLQGRGRRLRLRWPGRWVRQPRSVTWLPGPLSWWCRRFTPKTVLTSPPSRSCRRRRGKKWIGRGCLRITGGTTPLCQARPLLGRGSRGRKRGRRSFRRLPFQVGDVPVLFSDKFQQSKVYVLKVLQIQFIDDFSTLLLCSRDRYPQCTLPETPVVMQRLVGWSRQCRLEAPQLQFVFKVVVFLLVPQRQIPHVFEIPQLPYIWWSMSLLCSCTRFHRSLTCPLRARTDACFDGAVNCGGSAVVVHQRSSTFLS